MKIISNLTVVLMAVACVWIADADSDSSNCLPPKRSMVVPAEDAKLPSKKAEQARLMRKAAESLEADYRKEIEDLQNSIKVKISKLDISDAKFKVSIQELSFMEIGTNLVLQATLNYKEK